MRELLPEELEVIMREGAPQAPSMQPVQVPSAPLGMAQRLTEGLTFGWGDEAGIALAAAAAALQTRQPFPQVYQEMKQTYEAQKAGFGAQRPGLAMGATMAGGLASTLALPFGTKLGNLLKAHPYLGGAAAGGGLGAVYGAGEAPDMESMGNEAASNAIFSSVLGLGLPVAGTVASKGGKVVHAAAQKALASPETQAAYLMRKAFKSDQMTPPQVGSRFRQMGSQATGYDVAGESGKGLVEAAITPPGAARNRAVKFHSTRMAESPMRLESDLRNITGAKGKYLATMQDILKARKEQAAPLYKAAENDRLHSGAIEELVFNLDNAIAKYANTPIAATLASAKKMLFNADGSQKTTIGQLHAVKHAWDGVIAREAAAQGVKGKGASAVYPELSQAKNDLLFFMDNNSKAYQAARAIWADESAVLDALKQGRKILTTSADESMQFIRGLNAAEKDAFRIGAVDALRDSIMRGQKNPNALIRERMRPLFEDEKGYQQFMRAFARERVFASLGNRLEGSPTARRAFAMGEVVDTLDAIRSAATGDKTGAVMNAIRNAFSTQRGFPAPVRDAVVRMMLTPGRGPQVVALLRTRGMSDQQIKTTLSELHAGLTGFGTMMPKE